MKKLFIGLLLVFIWFSAFADWSYGTASFRGNRPSNCRNIGGVQVWYNGNLNLKGTYGGVEIWEGTGDICVAYPKNYSGKKMEFTSSGGSVQIRSL